MIVINNRREQLMTINESGSFYLKEAMQILSSSRGKRLTPQEREKFAIELAANMLNEANRTMTWSEKRIQAELSRMMRDPVGKVFTTEMTDQCFRSHKSSRVANQLVYLLMQTGNSTIFRLDQAVFFGGLSIIRTRFLMALCPDGDIHACARPQRA